MAEMKITVIVTAPDGMVDERSEEYQYDETQPEGDRRTYWSVYRRDGDIKTGMGFSGCTSNAQFVADRKQALRKQCDDAYKSREAERMRAAEVAKFDALLPLWEPALKGLQDKDDIIKALRHACEWHDAFKNLEELVRTERLKFVRGALREYYRAARAEVREQYPDDYRSAEDKEEFYADFADEVAEQLARNM